MLAKVCVMILFGTLSTGCARQLYHYHRTVVGVDISGNVSGQTPSGHLTLGYSRGLVVVIPDELVRPDRSQEGRRKSEAQAQREGPPDGQKEAQKDSPDAPSTIFCTQVKASLGGVSSFREILATGDAAEKYAEFLASSAPLALDTKFRNFVCPDIVIPAPTDRTKKTDQKTSNN